MKAWSVGVREAILRPDGILLAGPHRLRAAIGRGRLTAAKQEGDGATPAGRLPLRRVLYRADRLPHPPSTTLPRAPIAPTDGWCDDPASPDYNRQVMLPHPARHERLFRSDGLYDVIAVLGWNEAPVQPGRGSAIFLHVATDMYTPTDGCIAVSLVDLLRLLAEGLEAIDVRIT